MDGYGLSSSFIDGYGWIWISQALSMSISIAHLVVRAQVRGASRTRYLAGCPEIDERLVPAVIFPLTTDAAVVVVDFGRPAHRANGILPGSHPRASDRVRW